jgi:hypothetical protein
VAQGFFFSHLFIMGGLFVIPCFCSVYPSKFCYSLFEILFLLLFLSACEWREGGMYV